MFCTHFSCGNAKKFFKKSAKIDVITSRCQAERGSIVNAAETPLGEHFMNGKSLISTKSFTCSLPSQCTQPLGASKLGLISWRRSFLFIYKHLPQSWQTYYHLAALPHCEYRKQTPTNLSFTTSGNPREGFIRLIPKNGQCQKLNLSTSICKACAFLFLSFPFTP